ncbi:tryptophan-rich sensory protein [Novosphingobium sp. KCTC 2891]|uniref:TspO/MBR family protein n=1 Tax=Novosphingobium sp. KCTC 2891 TaxID=2989730 RepID=UPI0022229593|nr:TspO/MBR family protein [Novosphingobium sp. KCTC 2891]MCW1384012.1 tryptophan-rich sensory protein [Novosphingobium sp. KCTC 2891]
MRYLASPAQLRASLLRWSLFTVPLVLGLGLLSGRTAGSGPGNAWFDALNKPAIYPPPVTFAIVWSVLYVLMGIALAMIIAAWGARGRGLAIGVFVVQLALNLAWSPVFFALHRPGAALWIIAGMILAVLLTVVLFTRIRPLAGVLLLPYLAWTCFAAVLNWQFVELNPGAEQVEESGAAVRVEL